MATFTEKTEYDRLQCPQCGVAYYFPAKWCKTARRDGKSWECPNGHGQWFGGSEFDKLRRERDRLKQDVARAEDDAAANLRLARLHEKSAVAYKGHASRLKKRVKAGVCPCCNRTFQNLQRHMATKHADLNEALTVIEGGKR